MEGVWVQLSDYECEYARYIGQCRQYVSESKGLRDKPGLNAHNGAAHHVLGAAGEIACAHALNVFWPAGINTFKQADLIGRNGEHIEVRTRHEHADPLLIERRDSDAFIAVLVTGSLPRLCVRGWIPIGIAKQCGVWQPFKGREKCWVDQTNLYSVQTLLDSCQTYKS